MSVDAPMTQSVSWTQNDDLLLLFTDGIADARNADGEPFGEGSVLRIVAEHRTEAPSSISGACFGDAEPAYW